MATYKGIKGFTIQSLSADPPAPALGEVWYNSTSNVLKGYSTLSGAWSSGGAMNTNRRSAAGAGTQTAALATSGLHQPPGALTKNVEAYDGTSWTEVANITGVARYDVFNAGTQTAALIAGGYDHLVVGLSFTEVYNGTSWTEVSNLGTGRYNGAMGVGIETAALAVGGKVPSGIQNLNEEYNGTSWSEDTDCNTARYNQMGSGTVTAALVICGQTPATVGNTESWNGTAWTEVNNVNTARHTAGSALGASNTTSLIFGGYPPISAITESYDGTSWTEVGDLALARRAMAGAGIGSAALAGGGQDGPPPATVTATEEWNSGDSIVTFTSS